MRIRGEGLVDISVDDVKFPAAATVLHLSPGNPVGRDGPDFLSGLAVRRCLRRLAVMYGAAGHAPGAAFIDLPGPFGEKVLSLTVPWDVPQQQSCPAVCAPVNVAEAAEGPAIRAAWRRHPLEASEVIIADHDPALPVGAARSRGVTKLASRADPGAS